MLSYNHTFVSPEENIIMEDYNKLIQIFFCLFVIQTTLYIETMDTVLEQAEKLVKQYKENTVSKKPIIAIAGGSSVGKTHFTKKLLDELEHHNIRARVLPLDYFFNPSSNLDYALESSEFNNRVGKPVWQFDHRLVHQVLKDILSNKSPILEPHLDFNTKVKTFSLQDYSEIDLVVIEGTYALSGSNEYNLAKYSTLKIFMDVDKGQLLAWYCARKRADGHPNPEEDSITAWDFEEDYEKVIAPSKVNADIILHQTKNREYYD